MLEFKSGQIDGGSEPAPYDVQMVQDGGKVLLSEPGVTTLLVVSQSFLTAHPAVVAGPGQGAGRSERLHQEQRGNRRAGRERRAGLLHRQAAQVEPGRGVVKEITFTDDPDESSLTTDAQQATSTGLLKPVNLAGIFDLGPLNTALSAAGEYAGAF